MTGFESLRVDAAGRETEVLTAGDPASRPLLVLHGAGVIEGFDPFLALSSRFRLLVPYMPGYGGTDVDPPVDSIDDVADWVAAVLDAVDVGPDPLPVVGHSLGGWLAAVFTARHPGRVSRLVLAAPYGLVTEGVEVPNVFAMAPPEVMAALTRDASVWEGRVPSSDDAAASEAFGAAREREALALSRFVGPPPVPGLADQLPALASVETMLVWGDDDHITPSGHADAWTTALPSASLRMFPGRGHLLFHESPEPVRAVGDFAAG